MSGCDSNLGDGPKQIAEAVRVLRCGEPIAFPTETVYGLGAIAFDEDAVRRVFEIKGRPATNPLIVHVLGVPMARTAVSEWPEAAERLAEAFWPGPLSIVLRKSERLPPIVTAGLDTVGLRAPRHPLTLALLEALGEPIVGPSANMSGALSPTTAQHVRDGLGDRVPCVLDGGACAAGVESTVVTLAGDSPRILRPGVVGRHALSEVLGVEVPAWQRPTEQEESAAASPGLVGPHYRPKASLELIEAERFPHRGGNRTLYLILRAEPPAGGESIRMPNEAGAYAARLYAALHQADADGHERIVVESPPKSDPNVEARAIWRAVRDRLERASYGS